MPIGKCKLTGSVGKLVRSHIIPKALTQPENPGIPFTQSSAGKLTKRRWSSWYDSGLVTQEGEDILSEFDDWGIRYLRKQELVWSSWGPRVALGGLHTPVVGTPWGVRQVEVDNPHRLRLFFLSLLWRAAASELPEFAQITIPPDDLERLRLMIVKGNAQPLSFYAIALVQLSTRGIIHNMTPLSQKKVIPTLGSSTGRTIPIFRFYFDGLVVHIHRQADDDGYAESLGSLIVGNERSLRLTTVTFEQSFESENLSYVLAETITK